MRPIVLFLLLCLSGCIGTNGHKIDIRQDRFQAENEFRPEEYQKELEDEDAAREARRIPGPLKRRLLREELKKKRIRLLVSNISPDPWKSYETERSGTLYRKWSDVDNDPPTIKELIELAIEQGDLKRPELPKEPDKKGDDDDDDDSGDDDDDDDE